jgi:large subunit ribosomal protein L19
MAIKTTYQDTEIKVGDTIKVNYKIKEKDKERIQAFDGLVLAIKGRQAGKTILVRKDSADGIKVERIFPLNSPWIDSIKKLRSPKSKIHRAKLYHLRQPRVRAI